MSYVKKEINGTKITLVIKSSNLLHSVYDNQTKELVVTFMNGTRYKYKDVNPEIYTEFQQAESQGKVFNKKIRSLEFEKIDNNPDFDKLLEIVNK